MQVTIIDNKKKEAIHCCLARAAEIIGVTKVTLYNWSNKQWKESYNQFDIIFNSRIIKQKRKVNIKNLRFFS